MRMLLAPFCEIKAANEHHSTNKTTLRGNTFYLEHTVGPGETFHGNRPNQMQRFLPSLNI
jgi:hypothetical protein